MRCKCIEDCGFGIADCGTIAHVASSLRGAAAAFEMNETAAPKQSPDHTNLIYSNGFEDATGIAGDCFGAPIAVVSYIPAAPRNDGSVKARVPKSAIRNPKSAILNEPAGAFVSPRPSQTHFAHWQCCPAHPVCSRGNYNKHPCFPIPLSA